MDRIARIFLFLILAIGSFSACRNTSATGESAAVGLTGIESFDAFYEKFHQDSTFQMEHIVFPLYGLENFDGDPDTDSGRTWTAEEWKLHKALDPADDGYIRSFTLVNEGLIEEEIKHRTGAFTLFRRFSKSDDSWELIYYASLSNVGALQSVQ